MKGIGAIDEFAPSSLIQAAQAAVTNPWVLLGVLLLIVFFVAHAIVLSWADLSYVLLVSAIGYVFTAALGAIVLGEVVSPYRWAGIVLISAGVAFAGSTPESTDVEATQAR